MYILVYFKEADQTYQYEIFPGRDVVYNSSPIFEMDSLVQFQVGVARTQARVVAVSSDIKYLKDNFQQLTQRYGKPVDYECSINTSSRNYPRGEIQNMDVVLEDNKKKTTRHKATQTNNTPSTAYLELKRSYTILQRQYNRLKAKPRRKRKRMVARVLERMSPYREFSKNTITPPLSLYTSSDEDNKETTHLT